MNRILIKQVVVLPLAAIVLPIVWAVFVPGYSSVSQHLSELQVLQHPIAGVTRLVPILIGFSVMAFGIALLAGGARRMPFTAAAALAFGAANLSNGIFISGHPLHGLYGLAMFYVLVPACFAAELPRTSQRSLRISLVAAFVFLAYLWLQFSGLDPHGFRGLTQRLFVLALTGWFSYAGLVLLRGRSHKPCRMCLTMRSNAPRGEAIVFCSRFGDRSWSERVRRVRQHPAPLPLTDPSS